MSRFSMFLSVLILSVCLIGCQKESGPKAVDADPHDHAVGEAGSERSKLFPPFHDHFVGRKGGLIAMLGGHQFHAEFLADEATGEITVLIYDEDFMPLAVEAKEVTLNIMVGGEPKQYKFDQTEPGGELTVATYKLTDADLAKLLKAGWEGDAQVSIAVNGAPTSGKLALPKK